VSDHLITTTTTREHDRPSPVPPRVKALESLLVEKGLVDPKASIC
jgi:hypothetical protein